MKPSVLAQQLQQAVSDYLRLSFEMTPHYKAHEHHWFLDSLHNIRYHAKRSRKDH